MSLLLLLNSFFSTSISHTFTIFIPLLFLSPVLCKLLKLLFVHDPFHILWTASSCSSQSFHLYSLCSTSLGWGDRDTTFECNIHQSLILSKLTTYPIIKISGVSGAIEPMIWLSLQWDERTPSHGMGFTFHQKAVSYLRIAMPLVHYWKYPAWKIAIVCYTVHSWVRQLAGILLQTLALRIPAL